VGVVGEMAAVYQALPAIAVRRLRSVALPNAANLEFSYHSFLVVRMGVGGLDLRCKVVCCGPLLLLCVDREEAPRAWPPACQAHPPGLQPCSTLLHPCAPPLLPQALLCVYPFLWFRLYSFLFRQRAKKVGPAAAEAEAAGGNKKRS
jgi:hypothetical protein